MTKKNYILIHTDGSIEKTATLDDDIYELFDSGSVKIVETKHSKFLNEDSEWEDIPLREDDEDEEEEEEEELFLEDDL